MALSHINNGSAVSSTTASAAPGFVASPVSGDLFVLYVIQKTETATVATPAGWTVAVATTTVGTGAAALDAGQLRITIFTKISDGTETGTVTLTLTNNNVTYAQMMMIRSSNSTIVHPVATMGTLSDTSAGTTLSGTFSTAPAPAVQAGHWGIVIEGYTTSGDSLNSPSSSLTFPGITGMGYGGGSGGSTLAGNNFYRAYHHFTNFVGTSTGAGSWSRSGTLNNTGGAAGIVIRENASPTGIASAESLGISRVRHGFQTRLYMGGSATGSVPSATPSAVDAGWTGGTTGWRKLHTHKNVGGGGYTTGTSAETSATQINVLSRGFVLTGLPAQTLAGSFSLVTRGYELNSAADTSLQCIIRVLSPDGLTVRGVAYAGHAATINATADAIAQEWPVGSSFPESRIMSAPLTSVAVTAGDMLSVEVGWRAHNTVTTSHTGSTTAGFSTSNADYEFSAGQTGTILNPWIEFSGLRTTQQIDVNGITGTDGALSWDFATSAQTLEWAAASTGTVTHDAATGGAGVGSLKNVATSSTWRSTWTSKHSTRAGYELSLPAGDYQIKFQAKADMAYTGARLECYWDDYAGGGTLAGTYDLTTSWQEFTGPTVAVTAGWDLFSLVYATGSALLPTVWLDDVRITRIPQAGVGSPGISEYGFLLIPGIASTQSVGAPAITGLNTITFPGIPGPVGELLGVPSINEVTYFASAPTRESEQWGRKGLYRFYNTDLGVTWYRVGATWYQTNNPPNDLVADEIYQGGYDHVVTQTKQAELLALGFTIRTEIR